MAQGEKKRRGWKVATYRAYLRRPSCFKVTDDSGGGGGGGGGGGEGERRIPTPTPTHLVVMVNGIVGRWGSRRIHPFSANNTASSPRFGCSKISAKVRFGSMDWKFAAKKFVKKYPEEVIVHCSECNSATLTLDGVAVMGERLAEEVISVVSKRPWLQKISFVGHSLGGLIARYTIALLYEKGISKYSSEDDGKLDTIISRAQSVNQNLKGKIAGLEPMNFITFATPHLGSRSHKQLPLLCGIKTLEKTAFRLSWIARTTGKHLFLKDGKDGKPPLLLQMVTDFGDLRFMSALQSFKRRVAYSNVCGDFIVGRKTSSIRRQNELPKRQHFTKDGKYPHIVYVDKPKTAANQPDDFSDAMIYQAKTTAEMEEAMIRGLNRVPWERVDVSFKKSRQKIFAHNTIQVNKYFLHSDGADVIFHMIDFFLL